MASTSPTLPMSTIIAADAPLLSPVAHSADTPWDMAILDLDCPHSFYARPPSPPTSVEDTHSPTLPARVLKPRPDAPLSPQLCIPTHQLFANHLRPLSPVSSADSPHSDSMAASEVSARSSTSSSCNKRSANPALAVPKKRALPDRINSRDFVPPDVSGLSKREARLVKNRAAAFLSRQRKREEFECMEVRLEELQQENARLLALTKSTHSSPIEKSNSEIPELLAEIDQLRANLAASAERELKLSAELSSAMRGLPSIACESRAKLEAPESLTSPSRTAISSLRSSTGLGLLVLLCSLPSLLSMPTKNIPHVAFSLPSTFTSASAFDMQDYFSTENNWTSNQTPYCQTKSASCTESLVFEGVDGEELEALGDLDISFMASPIGDGKIRVRIHSPSSHSTPPPPPLSSTWSMSSGVDMDTSCSGAFAPHTQAAAHEDPFMGFEQDLPYSAASGIGMSYGATANVYGDRQPVCGMASEYATPHVVGEGDRRRVRVALKGKPTEGGEGGEWEVQIC